MGDIQMIANLYGSLTLKRFVIVVLIGVFTVGGCDGSWTSNNSPEVTTSTNKSSPLTSLLEFDTDVPARVVLDVSDDVDTWQVEFDDFETEHSLPVLGLRPGKAHTVAVSAYDEDDELVYQDVVQISTDPLPADFPEFSVTSVPELMEPGVTLFEAGGYLIIVDDTGQVVWYYRITNPGSFDRDVRRMSNGDLLLLLPPHGMMEIDMLGNTVRSWYPAQTFEGEAGSIPVDATAFHHEVYETESGNFLVLTLELRQFEDYPSSVSDPFAPTETANVVGDLIIEFSPDDGTIVHEWHMLDMLDPYRLSYSSLQNIWDGFFQTNHGIEGTTRDWSHGNGVIEDARDDSIIVSLRHQDAVVKFDRETGELKWILGTHANWAPEVFCGYLLTPLTDDDLFFQYHQHAPEITPDGNILVFDNGNNRASPFDMVFATNIFSRAAEYSINEDTHEVDLVWESTGFSEDEPIFAGFLGDADSLPETGNVLITFGGNVPAWIVEVTHTTPAEEVFEVLLPNEGNNNFVYRAERLPGLYP